MINQDKIATLRNVTLAYPAGNTAIERISITIFGGEVVGLLGSNGSGKTSLLKLISGYLSITGGYIELGAKPIEDYSERMLNEFVTLVEQNPESQLTGPTIEDELARACRMMGLKGREIENRVTSVLKDIHLENAREWFLDEISAGERRRVALGLALLERPKLLLLDEPLADLDEAGVKSTIEFIRRYKEMGVAIVVTAHKLDDIMEITDRMAVLSKGHLLAVNDSSEIIQNTEVLNKASVTVPPLTKLCVELQREGIVKFQTFPRNYPEAKNAIRAALLRK